MHALILAAALSGQYMMPMSRYPVSIPRLGPVRPRTINFTRYSLVGNVESVGRGYFVMRTPVERLRVRYGRQTLWLGVGHLRPGVTIGIDQMSRSVTFLPHYTLPQIADQVPQMRTGYGTPP